MGTLPNPKSPKKPACKFLLHRISLQLLHLSALCPAALSADVTHEPNPSMLLKNEEAQRRRGFTFTGLLHFTSSPSGPEDQTAVAQLHFSRETSEWIKRVAALHAA